MYILKIENKQYASVWIAVGQVELFGVLCRGHAAKGSILVSFDSYLRKPVQVRCSMACFWYLSWLKPIIPLEFIANYAKYAKYAKYAVAWQKTATSCLM